MVKEIKKYIDFGKKRHPPEKKRNREHKRTKNHLMFIRFRPLCSKKSQPKPKELPRCLISNLAVIIESY